MKRRIFLLSPANMGGERARMVLSGRSQFDLAVRLRREGAPLGEVFSFISGLYFRGKLAYAAVFASPPEGLPEALVITPGRGLLPPETTVTLDELREIAGVLIHEAEPRYRVPLERDARALAGMLPPACDVVLLGSVATSKYLDVLSAIFGDRLLFPTEFAGRGDMSRGGLLLRCARAGSELAYEPLGRATRHGPRPPKLPRL
ncbi:MAG TPA: hypothetical protein PLA43_13900 [Bryobacteraceae bacterium]|nr:hypothetical protein [Bryobacteraceae bacterium]HOL73465.1 hypothetical protein [Bryobacteraceae bacterium]HOQ46922.1 hypothetical protein [Bryobacteraceae bacterium]HPQ16212.1 hypothetical protein [Bryobacteraceae bacterium]HPU73047.1 hypothetical protein [Bryobacteraceae bacterium]